MLGRRRVQIGSKSLYQEFDDIGRIQFFSYSTPVAVFSNGTLYTTKKKYSVTTSRHMNVIRDIVGRDKKEVELDDIKWLIR